MIPLLTSSDYIATLYEDSKATLWIGTLDEDWRLQVSTRNPALFKQYTFIINENLNTSKIKRNAYIDDKTWVLIFYEDKQEYTLGRLSR